MSSAAHTPSQSGVYQSRDPNPSVVRRGEAAALIRRGRICIGKRKINLSQVFAGQTVGIREVEDGIWLVSSLEFDIGFLIRRRDA